MRIDFKPLRLGLSAGALAITATLGLAPSANAAYIFDVDFCTGSCLNGLTGGTVTLTQETNAVKVDVSVDPNLFHDTNAFVSFVFNLYGISTITVDNITDNGSTAVFALVSGTAGSIHEDGAGVFEYGVDQTAGATDASGLSFVVHAPSLTTLAFLIPSTNEQGTGNGSNPAAFFAAAVTNGTCTGVIGADGSTTATSSTLIGSSDSCSGTTPVPEPNTLAILGTTLIMLGGISYVMRRRREYDL